MAFKHLTDWTQPSPETYERGRRSNAVDICERHAKLQLRKT